MVKGSSNRFAISDPKLISLSIIFFALLSFNTLLAFDLLEAANLINQIEVTQGTELTCETACRESEINLFYQGSNAAKGSRLYFSGVMISIIILTSIFFSVALSVNFEKVQQPFIRWLPLIIMFFSCTILIFYGPTLNVIKCGLE